MVTERGARVDGRRDRHRVSRSRTSSITCPRRPAPGRCRGVSVGAGRLRQVLHLLRGALHPRRRVLAPGEPSWPRRGAWWRPARARSPCWARTSTPITARGPDGAVWGLGRLIRAPGRDRGPGAAALHHLAPARHGRRADRRPRRGARQADAVPASAGAVGLGPHPGGDEPAPRRRRLPPRGRAPARRRGPTWRCPRTSSSAFPARPTPTSPRPCAWSPRSATPRPTPSSTARARARRRRTMEGQVPEPVKAERLAALQQLLERAAGGLQRGPASAAVPVLLEAAGRRPGQLVGRSPYMQAVHVEAPAAGCAAGSPSARIESGPSQQPGRPPG